MSAWAIPVGIPWRANPSNSTTRACTGRFAPTGCTRISPRICRHHRRRSSTSAEARAISRSRWRAPGTSSPSSIRRASCSRRQPGSSTRNRATLRRVRLIQSDGERAPELLGDAGFDGVLCHVVLLYLDEPDPLVAALCRLARAGTASSRLPGTASVSSPKVRDARWRASIRTPTSWPSSSRRAAAIRTASPAASSTWSGDAGSEAATAVGGARAQAGRGTARPNRPPSSSCRA